MNSQFPQSQNPERPQSAHRSPIVGVPTNSTTSLQQQAMTPSIAGEQHRSFSSTHTQNGHHLPDHNLSQRRLSTSLPSPLAGTPLLTPSSHNKGSTTSFSQNDLTTPRAQQSPFSPSQQHTSSPALTALPSLPSAHPDPGHTSALPPPSTGVSPTKHSPPRPTTATGSLGFATPSAIPPVASLSPSPQQQDLSPPVKAAEPVLPRQSGQSVDP